MKRTNPEMILLPKKIGAMTAPWEDGGNHTYSVGSMTRAGRPVPVDHVWGAIKVYERDLAAAQAKKHGWGPTEARALTSILKGLGAALSLHYEGTIGATARDALMKGTRRNPNSGRPLDWRAGGSHASMRAAPVVSRGGRDRILLVYRTPDGTEDWTIAQGVNAVVWLREHPAYAPTSQYRDGAEMVYIVHNDAEAERRLAERAVIRAARRAARQR